MDSGGAEALLRAVREHACRTRDELWDSLAPSERREFRDRTAFDDSYDTALEEGWIARRRDGVNVLSREGWDALR